MHAAFTAVELSEGGKAKAERIRDGFSALLTRLEVALPKSREMSLVTTKLEEAAFFAQRANALSDKRGGEPTTTEEPVSLPLTQFQAVNLLAELKHQKYDEGAIADVVRALETLLEGAAVRTVELGTRKLPDGSTIPASTGLTSIE